MWVGSASDVAIAMELGADGVLLNTAVATSLTPVPWCTDGNGTLAGRQSYLAGRIPSAFTLPRLWEGTVSHAPASR